MTDKHPSDIPTSNPIQPPALDKKLPMTGHGQIDMRAPYVGVGQDIGGDPVTGFGRGPSHSTPTGTPFAKPVKPVISDSKEQET